MPLAYNANMQKFISIIELPHYQKFSGKYLSQQEADNIITYIAQNPQSGSLLRGTGGIRKIRLAISNNKGKSAGARIIYFYHNDNMPVFLLTGFIKSEMANLSAAALNELKNLTTILVKQYNGNN